MSKVITGIDKSKSYRVYMGITTDVVETARKLHNTTPLATAAMGRVLTGAGLMGLMMGEEQDMLTVMFKGDGPAKEVLATSDGAGNVKGYISVPDVDLPLREDGHLDVGGAIGKGTITVIKDLGLKEPYVGKIPLVSGEIAEDISAYYHISEQRNNAVALGVKIKEDGSVLAAAGMIIEMLPGAEEEAIDSLEGLLSGMDSMTTSAEKTILRSKGMTEEGIAEAFMNQVFENIEDAYRPEKLDIVEINWLCDCSKDRFAKGLVTIGKEELQNLIEQDGCAEVKCHFCEKEYIFNKNELAEIMSHAK